MITIANAQFWAVSYTHLGADLWTLYQPLAEAIDAYRDQLDPRDLQVVVEFLEFANGALAASTAHARALQARGAP